MHYGENGILKGAKYTGKKYQNKIDEDSIEYEIKGIQGEYLSILLKIIDERGIDEITLWDETKIKGQGRKQIGIDRIVEENKEYAIKVKYEGDEEEKEYTINPKREDIKVPEFNEEAQKEITIGEALQPEKYGWKVDGYDKEGEWRLFYQDKNYTYIIKDTFGGSYRLDDYIGEYTDGTDVSIIGQKLNPILEKSGIFFVTTNRHFNLRATAFLTDTKKWESYVDKEKGAIFAIGSPTLDLYAASYNATKKVTNTGATEIKYSVKNSFGCGLDSGNGFGVIKSSYNNGIYNIGTDDFWCLATPFSKDEYLMFNVSEIQGMLADRSTSTYHNVRPIVCFQTLLFEKNCKLLNE